MFCKLAPRKLFIVGKFSSTSFIFFAENPSLGEIGILRTHNFLSKIYNCLSEFGWQFAASAAKFQVPALLTYFNHDAAGPG